MTDILLAIIAVIGGLLALCNGWGWIYARRNGAKIRAQVTNAIARKVDSVFNPDALERLADRITKGLVVDTKKRYYTMPGYESLAEKKGARFCWWCGLPVWKGSVSDTGGIVRNAGWTCKHCGSFL